MLTKLSQIVSAAVCLALFLSLMLFGRATHATQVRIKSENTELRSLDELRWQYRLVLINSESQAHTNKLLAELASQQAELVERKLVVFIMQSTQVQVWTGGQPVALIQDSIQDDIEARLAGYSAILIGLDGGSKVSYEGLLLNDIFRDIDGMPMRRSER